MKNINFLILLLLLGGSLPILGMEEADQEEVVQQQAAVDQPVQEESQPDARPSVFASAMGRLRDAWSSAQYSVAEAFMPVPEYSDDEEQSENSEEPVVENQPAVEVQGVEEDEPVEDAGDQSASQESEPVQPEAPREQQDSEEEQKQHQTPPNQQDPEQRGFFASLFTSKKVLVPSAIASLFGVYRLGSYMLSSEQAVNNNALDRLKTAAEQSSKRAWMVRVLFNGLEPNLSLLNQEHKEMLDHYIRESSYTELASYITDTCKEAVAAAAEKQSQAKTSTIAILMNRLKSCLRSDMATMTLSWNKICAATGKTASTFFGLFA